MNGKGEWGHNIIPRLKIQEDETTPNPESSSTRNQSKSTKGDKLGFTIENNTICSDSGLSFDNGTRNPTGTLEQSAFNSQYKQRKRRRLNINPSTESDDSLHQLGESQTEGILAIKGRHPQTSEARCDAKKRHSLLDTQKVRDLTPAYDPLDHKPQQQAMNELKDQDYWWILDVN